MLDLNNFKEECYKAISKRIANGASMTKDNLKHAAEELVEAVEARGLYKHSEFTSSVQEEVYKDNFADELSDVIICVLLEAHDHGIDIEEALQKCLDKNVKRANGLGDKK